MNNLNQFIKYIKLDDEKRILVSLQNKYAPYLKEKQSRVMIKNGIKEILKEDFKLLEIGKNVCRITVKEGTEEENIKKIENELVKGLQMAMEFLANYQKNEN
ncbi:MAG: hypothetical protein FH751_01575 [Firmicutes bacterium]|nr:hypothetical protein [Bacillota bacterium]